jgi:hypothetical protein
MDSTTVHHLNQAHLAEMHRQAGRDALGRAGHEGRRLARPAFAAPGPLTILTRWTNHLRGRPAS